MNIKILCQLAFVLMLALGNSGCCTYMLVDSTHYQTQDTFNPSAVYQTTNNAGFALKGTRYNDATEHGLTNASHVFVLLPKEKLVPANLRTKGTLTLREIQNFTADNTIGLKTKTQLPANYNLVANLPPNHTSLVLQKHHPRRIRYVLVPFTLAADVVTFPIIQLPLLIIIEVKGVCP